jgi:predicted phosphate transport protein (TIGR00153 family)
MDNMEKKSYTWFERQRRTKALDLAREQMTKALDTVNLLKQTLESISNKDTTKAVQYIEKLLEQEKEVDKLRTQVFQELSKGAALFAEYREDLMHLVNRLDTLADHVKDAARCARILVETAIPQELWEKPTKMVDFLKKCTDALWESIEKITVNPDKAIEGAKEVELIEGEIDREYLETKLLFTKYGETINCGTMVIFDHLVEFIEHAADMCADTADYIVILAG